MTSARPGLHSSSQRRGVMPLVLFWNFSGFNSQKSLNLQIENGQNLSHGPGGNGSTPPIGWKMHSHALLHNFRVNLSHAVDGVRSEHAQMGHVDALRLTLLNEGHPPQTVRIARKLRRDHLTDAVQVLQKMRLDAKVSSDSRPERLDTKTGPVLRPGVSG